MGSDPKTGSGAAAETVRWWRRVVVGGVSLGVVLGAAASVHAYNFGSAGAAGDDYPLTGSLNGVWLTNNNIFFVNKVALTATYSTGVDQAMAQMETAATGFFTTVETTTCSDPLHDVCVYDSDYGDNGLNGWNACAGATSGSHPNQECSLCYSRINTRYNPPAQRIACHEIGHAAGLLHTSEQASCMKSTSIGGNSAVYSTHDANHLTVEY